jgi:hypothetical protein
MCSVFQASRRAQAVSGISLFPNLLTLLFWPFFG